MDEKDLKMLLVFVMLEKNLRNILYDKISYIKNIYTTKMLHEINKNTENRFVKKE